MRKLFSLFVALLATTALWAYSFQSGDLYYKITSDSEPYAVEVTHNNYETYNFNTIDIPETIVYEGITYSVTGIGEEAFNSSSLASIVIPNSITYIGERAFYMSQLTSVQIPNSVIRINYGAFELCGALESIKLGENINFIGAGAFAECHNLTSIEIPKNVETIGNYVFYLCGNLTSISVDAQNKRYGSFGNCNAIVDCQTNTLVAGCKNTTIPDGVTYIGDGCFAGLVIDSIVIPPSVKGLGSNVFNFSAIATIYCYAPNPPLVNESSLSLPTEPTLYVPCESLEAYKTHEVWGRFSNIQCIEEDEEEEKTKSYIYYTSSDGNIVNPTNANGFGANIISNTYENGQGIITFDGAVTSIGDNAFLNCSLLTSITIPNSITSIGVHAFDDCESLITINIPNSITSIGEMAFAWCSSLTSIEIPNSLISIENGTFVNCSSLTSVTIPNSVTNIGESAFRYCSSLTSITIPENVTSIGKQAFAESSSLDTIYCYIKTPLEITADIFSKYNATLFVPCESLEAYKAHEVWGQFENVQCIEEEQPQTDNLYYRYVMNADNTVLSETLLTQESFDKFTTASVKGDQQWTLSKSYGAIMNGYSVNMTHPNEDWLISPALDLAGKGNAILSFDHCFGPASSIPTTEAEKAQYTIWVSNDFTGDVQSATWTQLNGMMYGTTVWQYVSSGNIEIPTNYLTENCRIAWKYVCEDASAQWEIKNVLVTTPTNQVEVVAGENKYSGDITIPATTIFNGQKCDVVGIAEEAFYDCSALISITIPNSMKHIGEYAFRGCYALEKTNFVGDIADWCEIKFGGAYANPMSASKNLYLNNQEVKDLVIPNTVDSIHAYAFDCGNSITSVALPNSVVYIGEGAFYRTYINEIIIPNSVTSIEERVLSSCNALTSIIVEDGNPVYDSRDNSNAIIETNSNTLIAGCATTDIPNTIMHIGPYAFSYLSSLKAVEIPNSVVTIGDFAFYACSSLKSITIPNSVSHIGDWALYACYSLNSIVVEEGNSVYDSRNNCNAIIETATNSLIVACQNTVIPEGVTNIGEDAFFNCRNITSITLPNSVTNIEPFAFDFCSSLDTIYCYSTTPPTIHKYSFDNYNATLYVPCASIAEYTAHEVWSLFTNIQCIEDVETSIENTHSQSQMTDCQKIIRDGQLVIIRDGKTYNVMGQEL